MGAVLDGPASVPVMVASADQVHAAGPGAPIAAIASAVSAVSPFPRPAPTRVAYAPAQSSAPVTMITYSNGSAGAGGEVSNPAIEPAVAREVDEGEPADMIVIRNDAVARTTTAFAPLPPERPYELGITTITKTQHAAQPPQQSSRGEEDEVIAPRPPARPKQLATLFFASERLGNTQAFIRGNPFAGLKPQSFVRLRTQ